MGVILHRVHNIASMGVILCTPCKITPIYYGNEFASGTQNQSCILWEWICVGYTKSVLYIMGVILSKGMQNDSGKMP